MIFLTNSKTFCSNIHCSLYSACVRSGEDTTGIETAALCPKKEMDLSDVSSRHHCRLGRDLYLYLLRTGA